MPKVAKRYKEWVPKKKETSYHVLAYKMDPNGDFEAVNLVIDSEDGMIKDKEDIILLPDYARDSIILNDKRNNDLSEFCIACLAVGRRIVVLCERVAHVYYLGKFLRDRSPKFKIESVHGQHRVSERLQLKKDFATEKIDILIASSIFDEGEDLQGVGAVALASGGSSLVRQVQRIGRGVRRKSGMSNWCPVWFPIDTNNKFSKGHSIDRLEYLDRAEVTAVEATGSWADILTRLETEHGSSPTTSV
jgi:superfamily II DNA or RNA helicase